MNIQYMLVARTEGMGDMSIVTCSILIVSLLLCSGHLLSTRQDSPSFHYILYTIFYQFSPKIYLVGPAEVLWRMFRRFTVAVLVEVELSAVKMIVTFPCPALICLTMED